MKKIIYFCVLSFALTACGGNSNSVVIDSISPDEGSIEGGTLVTIKGENFVDIISVRFGTVDCASYDVISEIKMTCVTGANPGVLTDGIYDVEIVNIKGYKTTFKNSFTYRVN